MLNKLSTVDSYLLLVYGVLRSWFRQWETD